jgi:membrane-associated PAP2 superfamily phosphatase
LPAKLPADAGDRALPLWWLWVPAALAIVLLLLDQSTDLDRTITRHAFDAAASDFPLRGSFWVEVVMHHWAKYAVVTVGCLAGGALFLTYAMPALPFDRRTLVFIVLAIALGPLSVTLAKSTSARHCPWDIDEFGGYVPYTRLSEPPPVASKPGHCFPAGHASTGFALLAFYFAAYHRRMRVAAPLMLATGISAGVILGAGRVLEGAHFASHVAWSGLLCWTVMVGIYAALFARPSVLRRERQYAA